MLMNPLEDPNTEGLDQDSASAVVAANTTRASAAAVVCTMHCGTTPAYAVSHELGTERGEQMGYNYPGVVLHPEASLHGAQNS